MEAINYILGLAVIFAGFAVGIILRSIAKEELEHGKKYLLLFQKTLLFAIMIISVYFSEGWMQVLFAGILVCLCMFGSFYNEIIAYSAFVIVYFTFAGKTDMLLLLSALMFVYGFSAGSLFFSCKKTDEKSKKPQCPYALHNVFFGKEECHSHKKGWRQWIHKHHCRRLGCPASREKCGVWGGKFDTRDKGMI
jgi:F0F1-type ATP synthase membrane subunit c/vacuolar-type H+-ATPase subunit K